MAWLERMQGGQRVYVRPRCAVGRSSTCDLVLADAAVSSRHAEVFWDGQAWWLVDTGSKNGTTLDGRSLSVRQPVALPVGARLGFGGAVVWRWNGQNGPRAFAVCQKTGRAVEAAEGVLQLGAAACFRDRGGWCCDTEGGVRTVKDRQVVDLDGTLWQLNLPAVDGATETAAQRVPTVGALMLHVRHSLDEEDVVVQVGFAAEVWSEVHRNHHHLVLALARERLADRAAGQGTASQGWYDRELLLKHLGVRPGTLDQYVHRTRQQFAAWGVVDAERVVERRRGSGAMRLGITHVVVTADL